jgi:MSHA pilin protein MshD
MCIRSPCSRGFTLVELILLIVVVSVALIGVLITYQVAVAGSGNPQVQKQAIAVAEALLDEILLNPYDPVPGSGPTRADFNDVDDYNGYATAGGIEDINGALVPGLGSYNVTGVTVSVAPLNGVAESKRVTVTIAGPGGFSVSLDGYRLRFDGP